MKKYKKIKKIMKDREQDEGIRFLTKSIKKYFYQKDYDNIVKVIVYFLRYTYMLEILMNVFIYTLILKYIETSFFSAIVSSIVYIFQICFFTFNKVEFKLKETSFLYVTVKNFNKKILNKIFIEHLKDNYLVTIGIYFLFSLPIQLIYYKDITTVIIYLIASIVTYIYIYTLVYRKFKKIYLGQTREAPYKTEMYVDKKNNIAEKVILNKKIDRLVNMLSIYIITIAIITKIVNNYYTFNFNYIVIILFSLLPALINALLIKILMETILDSNNLKTNFYFFKKYKRANSIIKKQIRVVLKRLNKLSIIFFTLIAIISSQYKEISVLSVCGLVIVYVITEIKIYRAYSYNNLDYDDIKSNMQLYLISNFLEDYLLLGAPTILISIFLVVENKYHNLYYYMLFYNCYTLVLCIYKKILSIIKKEKKHVEN